MKENIYSKKEILIFEGFSRLVDKGVSLNSIRVLDIAQSAGIGKGTVYEYFKSKEEVIAKSILYKMNIEFAGILEESNRVTGFKEKCNVGFEETMKVMRNQFSYFQMLLTSKEIHDVFTCLNGEKNEITEFRNYILRILEPTIDLGIKEGIINSNLNREYIQSVFISVCSGICTMVHFKFGEITNEDIQSQKEIAYTMLIKSLS